MAENTILTKHPQGKRGRNIARDKYDAVAGVIRTALRERDLTHAELMNAVITALTGKFEGHISWYAETVKLDLEARGEIERTKTKPERYRLT
jgi:hypothetical protein